MPKTLIVDDNEQNLYMLQVLLESQGYEVVPAKDGAEALQKARITPRLDSIRCPDAGDGWLHPLPQMEEGHAIKAPIASGQRKRWHIPWRAFGRLWNQPSM